MPPDVVPPPPTTTADPRDELHAAPPFLTWPAIYAIVLGALGLEIVVFAVVTAACR